MTFGRSRTVERFLIEAHEKRSGIKVFVAEGAPSLRGREMALVLSQSGVDTTLISDSEIFAMMSRVNKVIIGTHAVMANGGLLAHAGSHLVAQVNYLFFN